MAARGQPWQLLRVSPSIALCTLRLPRRCPLAGSRPGEMASEERNTATTSLSAISKYVRPGGPGKGGSGRGRAPAGGDERQLQAGDRGTAGGGPGIISPRNQAIDVWRSAPW